MAEEPAAHAPDHRAVPLHERGEGRPVVTLDEAAEQLAVADPGAVTPHHLAKVLDHARRHVPPSAAFRPALYLLSAARCRVDPRLSPAAPGTEGRALLTVERLRGQGIVPPEPMPRSSCPKTAPAGTIARCGYRGGYAEVTTCSRCCARAGDGPESPRPPLTPALSISIRFI